MTNPKTKDDQDNNDIIEILEKKISNLEEIVEILLNTKIKDLEEKEAESARRIGILMTGRDAKVQRVINCRKCEEIFKDKESLDNHIKVKHDTCFTCEVCDEKFGARWKLEIHLTEHRIDNLFKYDQCNSALFLQSRLRQHMNGHRKPDRKYCHYFNNSKLCPFEVIGCKFRHENSGACTYENACRLQKCQYKHEDNLDNNPKNGCEKTDEMENSVELHSFSTSTPKISTNETHDKKSKR